LRAPKVPLQADQRTERTARWIATAPNVSPRHATSDQPAARMHCARTGAPGHVFVETVELEDLGDNRTKVTTTSLFHTPEERDGMLNSGMEGGVNASYQALVNLLAKTQ